MRIVGDVQQATLYLWVFLMLVWLVGMFMTRRTVRRQTGRSRFWQSGIVLFGTWLLFTKGTGDAWLDSAALPVTVDIALTGMTITAAGVAFAIWARLRLGRNWSGIITIKEGHTLVRGGPYRLVRHPIYAGILIGLAGTALTRGTVHSFLALPICVFGFWLKSVTEEQFMLQQFGQEYLNYQRQVRGLVPFLF